MVLTLTVNGDRLSSAADPITPLVDVLREDFHLTGAKPVCREGFCGACMALVDGAPTLSCLMPAALAGDCEIRTVEGLAVDGALTPIQAALEACDAVQCGMCFPGMLMTLTGFLTQARNPSREDIKEALVGNVCRCTGYERIIDAALSVARAAVVEGR